MENGHCKTSQTNPGFQPIEKAFDILGALPASGRALRLAETAEQAGLASTHVYSPAFNGSEFRQPESGRHDFGISAVEMSVTIRSTAA
jgi:hypothetical protein